MTLSNQAQIIFLDTRRGTPDRGWDPTSVRIVLRDLAVASRVEHLEDPSDLKRVASYYPDALYWPLNYTLDGHMEGVSVFEEIYNLGLRQVGIPYPSSRFTSKLALKRGLNEHRLRTPEWLELPPSGLAPGSTTSRCFVKTEFSSGSSGVRLAHTESEASRACESLRTRFNEQLFIEADIGSDEWTVACISTASGVTTAAISLRANDAEYIDQYAKSHNSAITMAAAPVKVAQQLDSYVSRVAQKLGLTGYFRLDVIIDSNGEANAIDLNVLPLLNADPAELSYVPAAFQIAKGWAYPRTVAEILRAAGLQIASGHSEGCLDEVDDARLA